MSLRKTSSVSARFREELRLKRILPGVAAGLVAGTIDIHITISLAVLIFSGELSIFVSAGIGLALVGAVVLGVVITLSSSYPGTISSPQDNPAPILALAAAGIVASMASYGTPQEIYFTVVAAIVITSLLTGAFLLVLGVSRLGDLVRYFPYPVVGGFLAGTGWLLVRSAMEVITGETFSFFNLASYFQLELLLRWLPALLFAIITLLIMRRHSHFLVIPGMLLVAILVFYLSIWLANTTIVQARAEGLLLGVMQGGVAWQPLTLSNLDQVQWTAIFEQAGNIGTILIISMICLLLNTSGIELTIRRDISLNSELRAAGLGNLATGLFSVFVGYQAISYSAIGYRMGSLSRLSGLSMALLYSFVLVLGAPFLSYFPIPVIGGLLLLLGLGFLAEWLFDAWFRLSIAEYSIIILILVAMNVVGVLAGVAIGLVFAVLIFVVNYSRVRVVKHTLSGNRYQSNVDRSISQRLILQERGDWLYILELQGFIFFGTSNDLLTQVRRRIENIDLLSPQFIVLDFRQVNGLDASAVLSFEKMKQLAQKNQIVLVLTHLSSQVQRPLCKDVFTEEDKATWHIEDDLDFGVEWCEEQILQIVECQDGEVEARLAEHKLITVQPIPDSLDFMLKTCSGETARKSEGNWDEIGHLADLKSFIERLEVPAGHYIIHQGDEPSGLFIIESGQVTAQRELHDGRTVRLRKMGPGTIVGEMSIICFVSSQNLSKLEKNHPEVAAALHKYIAQLLAERLTRANITLQALLE